jgi:hypothetical protein
MDADEGVEHDVQRDRVTVVLDLLGEGVGQAGEPMQWAGLYRFSASGASPYSFTSMAISN